VGSTVVGIIGIADVAKPEVERLNLNLHLSIHTFIHD
jgi:hypothetical protein